MPDSRQPDRNPPGNTFRRLPHLLDHGLLCGIPLNDQGNPRCWSALALQWACAEVGALVDFSGSATLKVGAGRARRIRPLRDGESDAVKVLEGSSPSSPTNFVSDVEGHVNRSGAYSQRAESTQHHAPADAQGKRVLCYGNHNWNQAQSDEFISRWWGGEPTVATVMLQALINEPGDSAGSRIACLSGIDHRERAWKATPKILGRKAGGVANLPSDEHISGCTTPSLNEPGILSLPVNRSVKGKGVRSRKASPLHGLHGNSLHRQVNVTIYRDYIFDKPIMLALNQCWIRMVKWLTTITSTIMSEENLQLRFDGPELKAHAMDVTLLAPSLLAFGEMCVEANNVLNHDKARVKVLVKADLKANCVTIDFQLVMSVWQHARDLVNVPNVMSAKEILEWLGIISGSTVTGYAGIKGAIKGVIAFLRWKKDRKIESTKLEKTPQGNVVIVKVEGDNNTITIGEQTLQLANNVKIVEAIKTLAAPVASEEGIEDAVFVHDKKPQLRIDKQAALELKSAHVEESENVQQFTAHIVTYGPILDPRSKHWKFKMNNRVENLDIERTPIAKEALERGGVNVGDTYFAKIEMTERQTKNGSYKTEYKVLEVMEFKPGTRQEQTWMPFNPDPKGS